MPPEKLEVQDTAQELKQIYGINKNISGSLSQQQQEELFSLLENNKTVLTLTQLFVAKNNELANNNRKYGKQRESAKRDLLDEEERNNELSTQVSQLKYELKELKNQLFTVMDSFHGMLIRDALNRSEIILFVEKLRDSFKK
ncbi:MAG: hypothetical protein RLZZ381_1510 [Cyanobacteriota bacterium]|jgi:seryl-tRNA synthetase